MSGRILKRWLLFAALAVFGCQEGSSPFVPVAGKVTYQGMPVPGGTIVFTPDAGRGNHGGLAIGEIQPDGSFRLRTGKEFGAGPGWYRVTVAAVRSQGPALPGHRFSIPSSLLPEKYRDPELSQLTCEVKADRANTIDFPLQ